MILRKFLVALLLATFPVVLFICAETLWSSYKSIQSNSSSNGSQSTKSGQPNYLAHFGEHALADFASTTEEVQTEFAGGYHMDETVTTLVIVLLVVAIVVIIDAAT